MTPSASAAFGFSSLLLLTSSLGVLTEKVKFLPELTRSGTGDFGFGLTGGTGFGFGDTDGFSFSKEPDKGLCVVGEPRLTFTKVQPSGSDSTSVEFAFKIFTSVLLTVPLFEGVVGERGDTDSRGERGDIDSLKDGEEGERGDIDSLKDGEEGERGDIDSLKDGEEGERGDTSSLKNGEVGERGPLSDGDVGDRSPLGLRVTASTAFLNSCLDSITGALILRSMEIFLCLARS